MSTVSFVAVTVQVSQGNGGPEWTSMYHTKSTHYVDVTQTECRLFEIDSNPLGVRKILSDVLLDELEMEVSVIEVI